ncbi:MAG: EamA family transporter RarD [Pseudomonadota bacterium]
MTTDTDARTRQGVISAVTAYTLWGVLPLYLLAVIAVSSEEILAHRVLWSVPFGALIISLRSQWGEVTATLRDFSQLRWLMLAAAMITVNWLVYIIAVQNGQIFQASLGYYINPLIYVLVGVVFFGDQLGRLRLAAIILAAIGVLVLTVSGGEFPYVSLTLGISFTIYGVIRKQVSIGAMPGLFIEVVLLAPFALAALVWMMWQGDAAFGAPQTSTTLYVLMVLAGPVTVVPLVLFAIGARLLTLSTIGFLQFIGPSIQWLIGYLNGETLSSARLVCFAFIWTAVILFCVDSLRRGRASR